MVENCRVEHFLQTRKCTVVYGISDVGGITFGSLLYM